MGKMAPLPHWPVSGLYIALWSNINSVLPLMAIRTGRIIMRLDTLVLIPPVVK